MRYRKSDAKNLLKSMARSEGISVKELKEIMSATIEEARNNPDPEQQAEFNKYFGSKTPTPEEYIVVLTNKA